MPFSLTIYNIRVVCPWGVGGGADAISRKISSLADPYLGVSTYVVNIEGGVSGNGVFTVMSAKPDGYTIGTLTYDSVVTVPREELVPGYSLDKLELLCLVTREGDAFIVRDDAPWATFEDFVKDAESSLGKLSVGNHGFGSGSHLSALVIESEAGIEVNHVPYPGGAGPQKEAILSGEVDAIITSLGDFAAILKAGDERGIAVAEGTTNPQFTDVPTFIELGYELVRGSFIIVAAPVGTPEAVLETLEDALHKAHKSSAFQGWTADIGVQSPWLGRADVTKWALQFQQDTFDLLDRLVAAGIIEE